MKLKLRLIFIEYGLLFVLLLVFQFAVAALSVWLGIAAMGTWWAFPFYLAMAWPMFTVAQRISKRQRDKVEAREKENVLEKLARL